ncbi:MAG: methyltransferase domain-containing protein [Kiritimatiellaeota bacterium]|nr:methyltransferase domain-containing protein [Kiritimatiellota bacterium]
MEKACKVKPRNAGASSTRRPRNKLFFQGDGTVVIHILTNTYSVIDPCFARGAREVELDMGCGKGRFLLGLARRYPERVVLGSDVMLGRLRRVQRKVDRFGLRNVELLRAENLELAAFLLPDRSIHRVHLLCPDPWPKARHRGRRLITSEFIGRLLRILAPQAVFHVATDHAPYLEVIEAVAGKASGLEPAPTAVDDIADLRTDFELQWLAEGRQVRHLSYRFIPAE